MLENKARAQRNYLSGMAVANDMLRRGLISEADFSALETVFAGKYRPLFRYEKPCLSPTLLITQTDEGSGSCLLYTSLPHGMQRSGIPPFL